VAKVAKVEAPHKVDQWVKAKEAKPNFTNGRVRSGRFTLTPHLHVKK
jgi:hypothetical protein